MRNNDKVNGVSEHFTYLNLLKLKCVMQIIVFMYCKMVSGITKNFEAMILNMLIITT